MTKSGKKGCGFVFESTFVSMSNLCNKLVNTTGTVENIGSQ